MRRTAFFGILVLLCSVILTGCTAIHSQVVGSGKPLPDGIPYFLPRRPFIITVTTPYAGGPPSITVTSGNAEPELSKEFMLSSGINLLAQNEFNITVANNGLLRSSNSTATSEVATVVQNAAATAGMLAAPGPGTVVGPSPLKMVQDYEFKLRNKADFATPPKTGIKPAPTDTGIGCPLSGTSAQYMLYPELTYNPVTDLTFDCKDSETTYTIAWVKPYERLPVFQRPTDNSTLRYRTKVSGIFFRQELPYLVVVTGKKAGLPDTQSHFVVSSPDESDTYFFHVTRNFFANNTANIAITDGAITGVDQTTQSEVAGLVGLPATFLGSYMTAVGQLFSGLTSISSGQQKYLQQLQATSATQNQGAAVAAAQYQACRKTVASFNFANMSAAQASAAAAAIQAACGSSNSTGTSGSNGN
jgi:hypothetical protein